jgi:metallo-beta-lactamase family protein
MAGIRLTFWGAAGRVTGSMHLLEAAGARVLLDAGLFQGHRAAARELNAILPFDPRRIDAIILSHAHIDHAGRIPLLVNRGFHGPIYATPATRDISAVMLADAAHVQEKDFEYLTRHGRGGPLSEPLYTTPDAVTVQNLIIGLPYRRVLYLRKHLSLEFTDAGHILGSGSVTLEVTEAGKKMCLVFSGDVGRPGLPIIRDPDPPKVNADVVIMESTYGDRDHESVAGARDHMARVVRETAARGGRIMIPAFAVGRAQELVYDLHVLANANQIPRIPIVIDSPLATAATAVFEHHSDLFDQSEAPVREIQQLFRFDLLSFTNNVNESKALNTRNGPLIIIAGSGMVEGGRILHHLVHGASDSRNTILIVGFQAEHTLGRRIVEKQKMIKVFGEEIELRAQVEILNGYSAHADRTELAAWLDQVRAASPSLRQVYLVHGEAKAQDSLAERLRASGYSVSCPHQGDKAPA